MYYYNEVFHMALKHCRIEYSLLCVGGEEEVQLVGKYLDVFLEECVAGWYNSKVLASILESFYPLLKFCTTGKSGWE